MNIQPKTMIDQLEMRAGGELKVRLALSLVDLDVVTAQEAAQGRIGKLASIEMPDPADETLLRKNPIIQQRTHRFDIPAGVEIVPWMKMINASLTRDHEFPALDDKQLAVVTKAAEASRDAAAGLAGLDDARLHPAVRERFLQKAAELRGKAEIAAEAKAKAAAPPNK